MKRLFDVIVEGVDEDNAYGKTEWTLSVVYDPEMEEIYTVDEFDDIDMLNDGIPEQDAYIVAVDFFSCDGYTILA